ncbi:pyridoxal phosphate-dependent aminotransferase [Streptomyces sp. NPDC056480]|uniref:pyridoxal phosphate-dependent aminotransferase n=1 Tax=Streptomyces sp. NPDC056480 TaxID=3345833 RepID=UPI00369D22FB
MPRLAKNPMESRLSPIRETFKAVKEDLSIANLCLGDPYVAPPDVVCEAFKKAIDDGRTHYENDAGAPRLRELIAERESAARGVAFHPYNHLVVTNGGTNGIYSISRAVLDPGDEVLLPEPIWIPFIEITRLLNCTPVFVPTQHEGNYLPSIEDLEARVTPKTKMVVVVSPGNPTGAVYDREKIDEIQKFCLRHGLWLLHDEAYKDIVFGDRQQHSLVGYAPNVIGVRTLSKSHAMTGFRVGWVISSNEDLIDRVRLNVAYNVMCASTPGQVAAVAALEKAADYLDEIVDEYGKRMRYAAERLQDIGFDLHMPTGSFYLFPRHNHPDDIAPRLLEEARVAVVDGRRFGPSGVGHFRISCSVDMPVLEAGLDRISQWWKGEVAVGRVTPASRP